MLLVAERLVEELDGGIQTRHEETEQDVPVDGQVGERCFPVEDIRLVVVGSQKRLSEVRPPPSRMAWI